MLKYFEVNVMFGNHEEMVDPSSIPDGTWRGLAKDQATAESLAYEKCWDHRLDVTGCYPVYETQVCKRYLVSEGWGHIFVGNREEVTRWVYDRLTKTVVAAQVLNGSSWVVLNPLSTADLLESIHDNDAVEDADSFGLTEWDYQPSWEAIPADHIMKVAAPAPAANAAKDAGHALEAAYPLGYRSTESRP